MLSETIKERLSKSEGKLLNLIPADGSKISTSALAEKFYGGKAPINGRVRVTGLMREVQKKCKAMKDCPFIICASERAGPRPIEVWLEMRS